MRAVALTLLAAACGGGREESVDLCCPPPAEAMVPELQTTDDGRCLLRWYEAKGCLHVSFDPSLEGRATEIADVTDLWTAAEGFPCFEPPIALAAPPGDGAHWLHLRPPSDFGATDTMLIDGSTGIIRQASLELTADEFAVPLLERFGRVLGLDRAPVGTDSAMSGAARPSEADFESLGWMYGPSSRCGP